MGPKAKWEYFRAIYERYHEAGRRSKHMILDEFCQNTRYHRKYAIRLLNGPPPGQRAGRAGPGRRRGLSYSHQTLSILTAVWEAAGLPLGGTAESAGADLDALGAQAVRHKPGDRAATAGD